MSAITPAMTTAMAAAQAAINLAAGQGSIANVTLAELQDAIAAAEQAYAVVLAGSPVPAGINLDAINGISTLDGYNDFVIEVGLCWGEADVVAVLAYLGRIVGNLTLLCG
jgi:hypothetical protein